MDDQPQDSSRKLLQEDPVLTSRNLAKKIFSADLPEQYIRTIPAQSLYIALKRNGLQSSTDLLELASLEQCRLMIDFDCWEKSYFHEENFWQWLSLTTEDDDLALLQKLTKCFDLKIITLLISRYVQYEFFEEATDKPPAAGYFTPDKGRTWLAINIEDSHKHFLFGRLLALLFETDADLFYKLLALSSTQTPSVLEEESYQDKAKRLSAEGIPDSELAAEVNNPANEKDLRAALNQNKEDYRGAIDIQAVEPLIFDSSLTPRLKELLQGLSSREDFENELTYIMNCAIVRWSVEFYEYDKVIELSDKVKGAINIGLERCYELAGLSPVDSYKKIGLVKIYQAGLAQLRDLKQKAKELRKKHQDPLPEKLEILISNLTAPFPVMPLILKDDYLQEGEKLNQDGAPFQSLAEINRVKEELTSFS